MLIVRACQSRNARLHNANIGWSVLTSTTETRHDAPDIGHDACGHVTDVTRYALRACQFMPYCGSLSPELSAAMFFLAWLNAPLVTRLVQVVDGTHQVHATRRRDEFLKCLREETVDVAVIDPSLAASDTRHTDSSIALALLS